MMSSTISARPAPRRSLGPALAAAAALACLCVVAPRAGAQLAGGYVFRALDLPDGTSATQVRDAAVGMAVGYTIRPVPGHPTQAYLDAAAWRLDGSGEHINLHRVPGNLPPGVNMLVSEALGIDDSHQIGGMVDRLTPGVVGGSEGAYWPDPGAFPIPLSSQSDPLLDRSTILDVDGRWAVGEGHRLTGLEIGDRAWAWDTTNGNRVALLGPNGEGLTYASEIEGRTVIGHRQFTTQDPNGNYVNYWRPMAWDLGDGFDDGDLSGLATTELGSGGLQIAYANGVSADGTLAVGQGRDSDTGPNHALVWDLTDPTASPRDLHGLVPSQYERSGASDALGNLVVGNLADDADLSVIRAVAWDLSTDAFIDLHQFLPEDVISSSGTAINRSGQIVGDFVRADGTRGVFVLTPDFAAGDSTGDGLADVLDLQILANHYGQDGRSFFEGDFTLDGSADFADLLLISQAYTPTANTVPGLPPYATFDEARQFFDLPMVPEPSTLALAAAAGLLALRRRR